MSCPYRTKPQFVNWLVRYKGWKKSDADNLNVHEMRTMYYKGTPKLSKNLPVIYKRESMDYDEACRWYQEQCYNDQK